MTNNDYIEKLEGRRQGRDEALRLAEQVQFEMSITDGVPRWHSNDAVPPEDVIEFAIYIGMVGIDVEAATAARLADTRRVIEQYRRNQGPASDEERYEMRAAFGAGEEVVNVITGRRTRT